MVDVSFNKLDGTIPSSIWRMKNLETFYINHNHLHGIIPKGSTNGVELSICVMKKTCSTIKSKILVTMMYGQIERTMIVQRNGQMSTRMVCVR